MEHGVTMRIVGRYLWVQCSGIGHIETARFMGLALMLIGGLGLRIVHLNHSHSCKKRLDVCGNSTRIWGFGGWQGNDGAAIRCVKDSEPN